MLLFMRCCSPQCSFPLLPPHLVPAVGEHFLLKCSTPQPPNEVHAGPHDGCTLLLVGLLDEVEEPMNEGAPGLPLWMPLDGVQDQRQQLLRLRQRRDITLVSRQLQAMDLHSGA